MNCNIDYNAPINISFKLDGESLKEQVNLRDLTNALNCFISILDNSYSVVSGQTRLSAPAKDRFAVTALDIKRNSVEFFVELSMKTMQLMAPVFGWENPYTIWSFAVQSFEYLKFCYEAKKKNIRPKVEVRSGENTVTVNGDNNIIYIGSEKIPTIAEKSFADYQSLSKLVDGNNIKKIIVSEINDKEQKKELISLDKNSKDIFYESSEVDTTPIEVVGDILKFDKENMTGKIRVAKEQQIAPGEYNFTVIGEQDKNIYINAMEKNSISAMALIENKFDHIKGHSIHKLQLIKLIS